MSPPRSRGSLVVATACAILLAGLAPALTMGCASTRPRPIAQEWFDLGNAWLEKGDWKKAGQAYSRALALDPSFAGASYNLARALTESGDYDQALRALDALAKRDPGNIRMTRPREPTPSIKRETPRLPSPPIAKCWPWTTPRPTRCTMPPSSSWLRATRRWPSPISSADRSQARRRSGLPPSRQGYR